MDLNLIIQPWEYKHNLLNYQPENSLTYSRSSSDQMMGWRILLYETNTIEFAHMFACMHLCKKKQCPVRKGSL